MASRELSILVTAKNMASRVLNTVKGDVRGVEGAAARASSNAGRNIGIATTAIAAGLAVQVKAGVDSLVELERVNNLTAAALESTGNVAQQSVEGIRARAEALERLTGVDDKAIQNAENLLLTFKGVGKDAFEPTLEAVLNLNAAMGGDDDSLQGVMLQVAKAMNDPVQGMTALRRSGVSFTKEQIKQIKALQESGDLMGAQAILLGELESQFGGAAEAANQGASKAQKQWSDAVEDIQMTLAKGFLPLIERVSGKMSELVADPAFMAGVEDFGETLAGAFDAALNFAESIPWDSVGAALQLAGSGAKMAMDAFLSAPPWLQTAILTGWGLNKLTGGALGSLVSMVGQGVIKGIMNMNAGVVNINAATVNGGGGGVPTGPGSKPGRRSPFDMVPDWLKTIITGSAAVAAPSVPLAGGLLVTDNIVQQYGDLNKQLMDMGFNIQELEALKFATGDTMFQQSAIKHGIVAPTDEAQKAVVDKLEGMGYQLVRTVDGMKLVRVAVGSASANQINEFRRASNAERTAMNAQRAAADRTAAAVSASRAATERGFSATAGLLGGANAKLGGILAKKTSVVNNITVRPVLNLSISNFQQASSSYQSAVRLSAGTGFQAGVN